MTSPHPKGSTNKWLALVTIALLPPLIVFNQQRLVEESLEVVATGGLLGVLRDVHSEEEIFYADSGRYGSLEEITSSNAELRAPTMLWGQRRSPVTLDMPSQTDSSYLITAYPLMAPWLVCSRRQPSPVLPGVEQHCSSDRLRPTADLMQRLIGPVAAISLLLVSFLGRNWKRSKATPLAAFALVLLLLILFAGSGGFPVNVSFGARPSLGDSVWSVDMLF